MKRYRIERLDLWNQTLNAIEEFNTFKIAEIAIKKLPPTQPSVYYRIIGYTVLAEVGTNVDYAKATHYLDPALKAECYQTIHKLKK